MQGYSCYREPPGALEDSRSSWVSAPAELQDGFCDTKCTSFTSFICSTNVPSGVSPPWSSPEQDPQKRPSLSLQMTCTAPTAGRFAGGMSSTSASRTLAGW